MNRSIRPAQIGISTALALLTSLPLVTTVRAAAAVPPLIVQAQQTINAAHSWKVTSAGSFGNSSTATVITFVRQGKTLHADLLTLDRQANGKKTTTEMVIGAKHTCMRTNGQGAWNCAMPSTGHALDTAMSLTPNGTTMGQYTWTPAGTRVVRGQACAGYNVTYADPGIQTHGTLWIGLAGKAPVLLTATGAEGPSTKHSVQITSTVVWSNWNDPSLSIPHVGA